LNIVFDLVNVKYKIKYADDVFCKQRSDKANALGEIKSKNRGILSGEKKGHKIIIHFAVGHMNIQMLWGSSFWQTTHKIISSTSLRANYLQPKIYDKIAATDTKYKCSVNSFSLH
jgi:hypothetical protein